MTDSLTTLISRVQAGLGDDGTIFTTALCTAAIREALRQFNNVAPIHSATLITGVDNQYEYELSDYDSLAIKILDILRQGDNADELDISITYDPYSEDERIFFRLRQPVTGSDTIIARYTTNHTVNGLDSATESTISSADDQIIIDGARAEAIMVRAVSRVETNNLNEQTSEKYTEIAKHFQAAFYTGLRLIANKKTVGVGEPDQRSWNDTYHGWDQ
jgi:hypothetical protein